MTAKRLAAKVCHLTREIFYVAQTWLPVDNVTGSPLRCLTVQEDRPEPQWGRATGPHAFIPVLE